MSRYVNKHLSFDEWNAAVKDAAKTYRCSPIAVISGASKANPVVKARWSAWTALHQRGHSFYNMATVSGFHHTTIMYGVEKMGKMDVADI